MGSRLGAGDRISVGGRVQSAMRPFDGSRGSGWALDLEKRALIRVARHRWGNDVMIGKFKSNLTDR